MYNRLLKTACISLLTVLFISLFGCAKAIPDIASSSAYVSDISSVSSSSPLVSSSSVVVKVTPKTSSSASPQTSNTDSKTTSSTKSSSAAPTSKFITLTIDATKGNDGIVTKNKQVVINSTDTVFTVLKRYCDSNKILISAQKTGNGEYVSSIDGVAQFDNGAESGWLYSVNGKFPSVDCNSYKLSSGETVKWIYTTDDGKTEENIG